MVEKQALDTIEEVDPGRVRSEQAGERRSTAVAEPGGGEGSGQTIRSGDAGLRVR
jgi:hypothetical protein